VRLAIVPARRAITSPINATINRSKRFVLLGIRRDG